MKWLYVSAAAIVMAAIPINIAGAADTPLALAVGLPLIIAFVAIAGVHILRPSLTPPGARTPQKGPPAAFPTEPPRSNGQ